MLPIKTLSQIFQTFAERECKEVSPLYYRLSHEIAKKEELLELAAHRRERQPIPNLFLAAIHYLLLQSPSTEALAKYYPSISKKSSKGIPIDLVEEFCRRRRGEIIEILQSRIVQTNAINRTAYLMPIFSAAFEGEEAVNIVDIGTSSGLTMNFDLYAYDYGEGNRFGESKVQIKTTCFDIMLPQFSQMMKVKRKIGIDQNPLDLKQKNNALWLKALIWADQLERFQRLEEAIEVSMSSNVELRKASKIQDFKAIIEEIPKTEPLAVYHTHVLYQFSKKERADFRQMLDEIGEGRDFRYLAVEGSSVFDRAGVEKGVWVELTTYKEGKKITELLAKTNGHADWIRWEGD